MALYPVVNIHLDIVYSVSYLTEFLTNLGPQYIEAIDRVIQYLYYIRFLAIVYHPTYNNIEVLEFFGNILFADRLG